MQKKQSYIDAMKQLESGLPANPDSGFLGCDLAPKEAKLVLIPVPWDVTTSYGKGASLGPDAVVKASHQVDLDDASFGQIYRGGIAVLEENPDVKKWNTETNISSAKVVEALTSGGEHKQELERVNKATLQVNQYVHDMAEEWLDQGLFVGVLGGDHAVPQGLIEALNAREKDGFGILHIDAHHDLREAYEGFVHSHASIHYNVMERCPKVKKLVQLGIRDYCAEEKSYMDALVAKGRGRCFYNRELANRRLDGEPFGRIVSEILDSLPPRVYVSFDIDGLDPSCCPSTGTPVPGGLSFDEAVYILERLAASGKKIIGFDLCEVAPGADGDEWDANVGARLLHKLCGALFRSNRIV